MPKNNNRAHTHFILRDFYKNAQQLRHHFEGIFSTLDHPSRFIWDCWNIPDQYHHLRTPAYHFFPKSIYERFHRNLVQWGRESLGCHDISPPWLSCYTDGHFQGFHADLPHGPWAFVFSLTRDDLRNFSGGETLLLKPEILNYWQGFRSERGKEEGEIFNRIRPRFNQLLVFDPRIPHAVQAVRGTQNLINGRLVIHGWFVQPRPFFVGPLTRREIDKGILDLTEVIAPVLGSHKQIDGIFPLKLAISPSGKVSKVEVLPHTLRTPEESSLSPLIKEITASALALKFRSKPSATRLVLPLVFESAKN